MLICKWEERFSAPADQMGVSASAIVHWTEKWQMCQPEISRDQVRSSYNLDLTTANTNKVNNVYTF